jgi:hypothetical protein
MKKLIKTFALIFLISLTSCSEQENVIKHEHSQTNKNQISLKQFQTETGINDFETIIKTPISANNGVANKTKSFSDFVIDTLEVKKHIFDNNKITFSFRVYPSEQSESLNKVYNLVYRKENNIWEKSIIKFDENTANQTTNEITNPKIVYDSKAYLNPQANEYAKVCTETYLERNCSCIDPRECDNCYSCVHMSWRIVPCGASQGGSSSGGYSDPFIAGDGYNPQNPYSFDPNTFANPIFNDANYINTIKAFYFFNNLSAGDKNWVNENPENAAAYLALIQYLIQNNWTVQSTDFANKAIEALKDGSDVDFLYKIIIDKSIDDDPCLSKVYSQAGKAPTFQNYLKKFDGNFSVANLKLETSSSLPNTINAITSAPSNNLITITFNSNNLNRPALSVVRTFIHELIHAEIFRKLLECSGLPNLNYPNYTDAQWRNFIVNLRNNYPGLYDYYLRYSFNVPAGQVATEQQHQLMAQNYRNMIVQALKEYNNNLPESLYQALAWEGLTGTVAWNNLSQQQKADITTTILSYNASNTNCQ